YNIYVLLLPLHIKNTALGVRAVEFAVVMKIIDLRSAHARSRRWRHPARSDCLLQDRCGSAGPPRHAIRWLHGPERVLLPHPPGTGGPASSPPRWRSTNAQTDTTDGRAHRT